MNYQAKTKYELIDELLKLQRENESLKISYSKDISECIKLLEEQRVREKYYSTLFDAVDEGFCIVEVIFDENEKPIDYRFLVINPSFEKQAGLTNATGKRMRELAPEHEKYWFEIYGKIAKTGQPERFENYAEQFHRWYDVYAFRIGQPETLQVAILFKDITTRKQIEEAHKINESLFRELYDNMKSGSVIFTVINDGSKGSDYIIKKFNRVGLKMEGKTLEEVVGKRFIDIRPNIDNYGLIQLMKKVWETGESGTLPTRIYIDEHYSNYYKNYVFKIPSGEVVTLYDDVTKSKRSDEALRLEKENFRHSLDDSPLGVCIATMEGNAIYANKTLLNFYGYDSLGELQKTPLKNRYSPESYAQAQKRKHQRERGDMMILVKSSLHLTWISYG